MLMKTLNYLLLFSYLNLAAQVGIGTNTPLGVLDIESENSTIILPRNDNPDLNIITPIEGMVVYDKSNNALKFFDGTKWNFISSSDSPLKFERNSGQVKINGYNASGIPTEITFENIGGNPINGDFTFHPIILDDSNNSVVEGDLLISSSPTTKWPKNVKNPSHSKIYDFDNDTFLENGVPGQIHIWRFIIEFDKAVSATGVILKISNPNPNSTFEQQVLSHLSPEHATPQIAVNIITIADELSLPPEYGGTGQGYKFEIAADDPLNKITIKSITRISLQHN